MAGAAGLSLLGWLMLLYAPGLSLVANQFLLFAIGAASGAMVICIAAARERAPAAVSGATTGFINTAMVGSGALAQPAIGYLLDLNWDGNLQAGVRVYNLDTFATALVILPLCAAVGLIAALFVPRRKRV